MFKIFGVIFALVLALTTNVFAETKKEAVKDTIPFVTYQNRVIYYYSSQLPSSDLSYSTRDYHLQEMQGSVKKSTAVASVVEQEATTNNIPTADVKNLVERVRDAVCSSVGDADVRVWISIDASGKLLGVGASTQSGLEVTFHCRGQK
jgi:hypothetical protein